MTKSFLIFSCLALLPLLGCGDKGGAASHDAAPNLACTDGETQEEACGMGTRMRTCEGESWGEWGECSDAAQNYIWVSGDYGQKCALRGDGKALCWIDQVLRETPDDVFVSLSNGEDAACGIKTDGTLRCWGYLIDTEAWRDFGAPTGSFSQIDVWRRGQQRVGCGILSDTSSLSCWDDDGNELDGPLAAPSGSFLDVSLEEDLACAVASDGNVICWGDSQLIAPPAVQATKVSISDGRSCALDSSGIAHCWRLLEGGYEFSLPNIAFEDVDLSGFALRVRQRAGAGCARTPSGTIQCFDEYGLLGPPEPGPLLQFSGQCGVLENGQIRCWGADPLCASIAPGVESANACGLCGELPYQPSETCACGGTFTCDATNGLSCADGNETHETATQLTPTDDTVDEFTTVTNQLDAYTNDWYQVRVEDALTGIMEPSFELSVPDGYSADLCIFYIEDSEDSQQGCSSLSPTIEFMGKSVGACCATATSGMTAIEDLIETSLGDTTNWTFMSVQYRGGPPTCANYTLRYRF